MNRIRIKVLIVLSRNSSDELRFLFGTGLIVKSFLEQLISYSFVTSATFQGDPEDVPPVPAKKLVDEVTQALVVGWRVLPPILTHAHIKLLQVRVLALVAF